VFRYFPIRQGTHAIVVHTHTPLRYNCSIISSTDCFFACGALADCLVSVRAAIRVLQSSVEQTEISPHVPECHGNDQLLQRCIELDRKCHSEREARQEPCTSNGEVHFCGTGIASPNGPQPPSIDTLNSLWLIESGYCAASARAQQLSFVDCNHFGSEFGFDDTSEMDQRAIVQEGRYGMGVCNRGRCCNAPSQMPTERLLRLLLTARRRWRSSRC
jgi:hypothetical protein